MTRTGEDWRPDFEQAMGETFGEYLSPPLPFEEASAHECCEVVWRVVGDDVTPRSLAELSDAGIVALSREFGAYFDATPPSVDSIKAGIAEILARWPIGSLGE